MPVDYEAGEAYHPLARGQARPNAVVSTPGDDPDLRLLERTLHHIDRAALVVEGGQLHGGAQIVYVNRAFSATTGYAPAEVQGAALSLLWSRAHGHTPPAWLHADMEEHTSDELLAYYKDGSPHWVEWQISPLGQAHAGAMRWLISQQDVAAQQVAGLDGLAADMAHNFNNLLTIILGSASLARLDLPPVSPVHQSITEIEQAAHRAAILVRQLLSYAHSGRSKPVRLDLGLLVAEFVQVTSSSIHPDVVLRCQLDPHILPVVANELLLSQALSNLVFHAAEALDGQSGVVTLSTRAVELAQADLAQVYSAPGLPAGPYALLAVTNIDAWAANSPFEPMPSASSARHGPSLAAASSIVRSHCGTLQVAHQPGAGLSFTVLLPCAPPEQA